MQVQPFQPAGGVRTTGSNLFPAVNDPRISVPSGSAPIPVPPSLFAVFLKEVWKRKALLVVWLIITAVIAGAVIFKYAKPMYRAEGKLSYIPNYRGGNRPLYNPPNIQTMTQIIKSMDAPESVRQKHLPAVDKDEFAKNLHVDVSKMSEFLDVSFDYTDPDTAIKIANAVMEESIVFFEKYRQTTLHQRSAEVKMDLERAMKDLAKAKDEYQKGHGQKGIVDLKTEIDNARAALLDEERNLRLARETESKLKTEIAFLKNRRENPSLNSDRSIDESFMPILQALQTEYMQKMQATQTYQAAQFRLDQLRQEEERTRVLTQRGIHPLSEYQKTVAEMKTAEAMVKQFEEAKLLSGVMEKEYERIKEQLRSGKPLRLSSNSELDKAEKDLATIPITIKGIEELITAKKVSLDRLLDLQRELGPKEEEITLIRNRVTELSAQLTDSQHRGKDPNADDLKVATVATTGGGPYATNIPKLGASILGISSLLFLGYISIFAMPQVLAGQREADQLAQQPRAVLAVVPVAAASPTTQATTSNTPTVNPEPTPTPTLGNLIPVDNLSFAQEETTQHQSVSTPTEHEIIIPLDIPTPKATPTVSNQPKSVPANVSKPSLLLKDLTPTNTTVSLPPAPVPSATKATPVPKQAPAQTAINEAVSALAKRISQEGVDRGSIVLFTPTEEQLQLSPIIGDLGKELSQNGNRVLVFDARTSAENPSWAGPNAKNVANRVEGYLNGNSDSNQCFVPTSMKNVEYSRADLTNRVSGVMSAHRFHQLVEEMRERYSLVLMVAPTMLLDGSDPLLSMLAEGLVLVTESTAPPNQIKAYIDHLAEQVPAPVYGALSVPKT